MLNDDLLDATVFASVASTFIKVPRIGATPWPFGTVLRPRGHDNGRRVLVLNDTGVNVVGLYLVSKTTRRQGSIEHYFAHDRWEPVEATAF